MEHEHNFQIMKFFRDLTNSYGFTTSMDFSRLEKDSNVLYSIDFSLSDFTSAKETWPNLKFDCLSIWTTELFIV